LSSSSIPIGRARTDQADQTVIDDAWSKFVSYSISLRGPSPSESSREVAADYAVGNARAAKIAATDFDSIDQTLDALLEALGRFHQTVTASYASATRAGQQHPLRHPLHGA
jgi:hypothetical protein